jgi:hypothetical protein
MGEFFEPLKAVWPLLMMEPWTFAALAVLLLFFGWGAGRFMFGERIANLKSRVDIRDEKIAALEARLLEISSPSAQTAQQHVPLPPQPKKETPPEQSAKAPPSLRSILLGKKWMFHFNPGGNGGRKPMTFLPDGTIGQGANKNEHTWRLEGKNSDLLVIYREDGSVQNAFYYSVKSGKFDYIPDSRAVGYRNQFIEPR